MTRAVVAGIPQDGTRTQKRWLDATDTALRALGIKEAESYTPARRRQAPRGTLTGADAVLVVAGYYHYEAVVAEARRARLPVYRV